jgi:hypothetical protein
MVWLIASVGVVVTLEELLIELQIALAQVCG